MTMKGKHFFFPSWGAYIEFSFSAYLRSFHFLEKYLSMYVCVYCIMCVYAFWFTFDFYIFIFRKFHTQTIYPMNLYTYTRRDMRF